MKASLITVDFKSEKYSIDFFEDKGNPGGPGRDAWDLWEDIKKDWPTREVVVVCDKRAQVKLGKYRTECMLGIKK